MKYEFESGDTDPRGDCEQWAAGIDHKTPLGGSNGIWYQRIECYGPTEADADALRDRVLDALQDSETLAANVASLHEVTERAEKAEAILLAALTVMECEGTNGYDFVADIYELLGKARCEEHIAEQISRLGGRS